MNNGYAGKLARVDLAGGKFWEEKLDEDFKKMYIGGHGFGARILYDEVRPRIDWNSPDNVIVMATGPMAGLKAPGGGTFCVVTKGAMTNGATSVQANGYLGAFLKFSGFDGIVVSGGSREWVYLYIHDGIVEVRNAKHLLGKTTWETEAFIKEELGKKRRDLSVFSIGPAGENLVRFACIVGDEGHVAAHNGAGAVMGSKRLKAVAVAKGSARVLVADENKLNALVKKLKEVVKASFVGNRMQEWGTSFGVGAAAEAGYLPVKNYTTNLFPEAEDFVGQNYRSRSDLELKRNICWACSSKHCHLIKITSGPYAGFEGEEPEYEQLAAFGPQIGNKDPLAAMVLANESDRLGIDTNESGWLVGWIIECYEKGIFTRKDTDGLEMTWGNVEAVKKMLNKVARREGIGDMLAEGIMRASKKVGGEAANMAIYCSNGNTPRTHDDRGRWPEMLDTVASSTGTIETGPVLVASDYGLEEGLVFFDPGKVAELVGKAKGRRPFEDSLGICWFNYVCPFSLLVDIFNAITGWGFSVEDANNAGLRSVNLMRAFNVRAGVPVVNERPSARYGSIPVDSIAKGRDVSVVWEQMIGDYYWYNGWDRVTGKPLPLTLKKLGLDNIIQDMWGP